VRLSLVALLVLALATGCGADEESAPTTPGPPTLPASALPNLEQRGRALGLEALAACGTCKKELPTFLAGWRRGATVLSLLASGSGANPERFGALARELDGTVG
jgi:hypothetical protein